MTRIRARQCGVLLAILAVLLVAACGQSPEATKRKALERGEQFLKDGKPSEAIIELRSALAVDRDFVPALHALGRAYAAKAWTGDAVRELGRAHALAPDSLPVAVDFARSLAQARAWQEAEGIAQKILSREPQNPSGLYVRATALVGQGKTEDAKQVLAGIPKAAFTPELEGVRGEMLLRAGDLDGAGEAFRIARAADPTGHRPLVGLARIQLARRNFAEALGLFEQAKKIRPRDPEVRLGVADSKAALGRMAEAIAELESLELRARPLAVQLSLARYYLHERRAAEAIPILAPMVERIPKQVIPRVYLAHAYLATGKAAQAATQFEALGKLVPGEPGFQMSLAAALLQQGRAQDALARLDPVAKALDKSATFHTTRARALLLVGRLDEAVRSAKVAEGLAPQDPQPLLILGMVRAQQGQTAAARELLARAAELNASYAPAHLALSGLYASERATKEALQELDRALEANPRSVVAIRTKAAALVQQRRTKEAIEFVTGATKRDPKDAGLQTLLATLYGIDRQLDKATAAFRRAAELDPRAVEPRLGLARLALGQANDTEAIVQLQAAVKAQPDHLAAVLLLTSLREKLGQYALAVPPLQAAVETGRHPLEFGLALAEIQLKQGRYDDVLARTAELARQAPGSPGPPFLHGQALLAKGDAPAAIKDLTEAARLAPKWAAPRHALALALARAGRATEAQAAYREAAALDPSLRRARPEVAAAPGKAPAPADQGERLKELQVAVKADPSNLDRREELARLLLAQGKVPEAQSELKHVLERAPGRAATNVLMAHILMSQDKADEGAAHLQAALKSNPALVEANLMLARYLLQRNRREEALAHLQAVLRVNPNPGSLHAWLVRIPKALELAQELERREPKSSTPPLLVGWALLSEQRLQPAADAFRRAIQIKPDLADAHRGLGQVQQVTGQVDPAIASYRQAVALNPSDASSLNNLAGLLSEERKRPDEALPLATRAVELASKAPDNPGPAVAAMWDTLGWIQYRRGAYAEAERALVRAAELAPKHAHIHFHLGVTYSRRGNKAAAVASLRRAAELNPNLAKAERIPDLVKELGG